MQTYGFNEIGINDFMLDFRYGILNHLIDAMKIPQSVLIYIVNLRIDLRQGLF